MVTRELEVRGGKVAVMEAGSGPPLVYLHGFADVHGVSANFLPFHEGLAQSHRVIAPAHPACNGSDELSDGNRVEDFLFHYSEVIDALGLDRFTLVGHCVGGWLAAEYAVRHPESVEKLVLIGACGLFVPGSHIGDIFLNSNPDRGTDLSSLRRMLFASADSSVAMRWYPDGKGEIEEEMRRYAMLRFGSAIGFKPPYFYHWPLVQRLGRARMPSLVIWGAHDGMTPLAHGEAYAVKLGHSSGLKVIADAGHAVHLEKPQDVLALVRPFLEV
jgi:pimeloyl-ACP methyl ester carboxylesterase